MDEAVFLFEQWSEGDGSVVLRIWLERLVAQPAQSVGYEGSAESGQAFGKPRRGFIASDKSLVLEDDVAGVHAGVDAHGSYTGDGFAVSYGPLDGSCAAIFGEKGGVKVDPAESRDIE